MRRIAIYRMTAALVLAAGLVVPVNAGQVRVYVGPGFATFFSPPSATVNPGDQVIWIWQTGLHSVNSGTPVSPTTTFRNSSSGGSNFVFSWKAPASGSFPYFCIVHGSAMTGTINIGGASVADFRITEVEFGAAGGADRVQISNLGSNFDYIDQFRISYQSGTAITLPATPIGIAANASVTLHLNASGTDDASNVYLPAAPELPAVGSFAIYTANNSTSIGGSTAPGSLTDPDQMIDYVEWGVAGQGAQPNRATAVAATYWPAGDVVDVTSVPNGGLGYSISYCGNTCSGHGAACWSISTPNFGNGQLCTTPTRRSTWGRVKALYR